MVRRHAKFFELGRIVHVGLCPRANAPPGGVRSADLWTPVPDLGYLGHQFRNSIPNSAGPDR